MDTGDFQFIEDNEEAFAPLIKYAGERFGSNEEILGFVSRYMYMYTKNEVSYFKHIDTREYLNLPTSA